MINTAKGFRLYVVLAAILALALASIPMAGAFALTTSDPPTPAAPGPFRGERIELVWARQRFAHDRMTVLFDHADARIAQAQTLIDRAKDHGKDVAAVQAALDAFAAAIKDARPTFESMTGIIASHQGFDANGSITDLSQATETVRTMSEKLTEVRSSLAAPIKALRDAIRAFRQSNQPAATPGA